MTKFDKWSDMRYAPDGEIKSWELFTKNITVYMGKVVNDHECLTVERTFDGIPFTAIELRTYHKSKLYTANIQIPMCMVGIMSEEMVAKVLDLFLVSFRSKFLKVPSQAQSVKESQEDNLDALLTNPNFLEVG